jgi:uncharacterized Zn-binding protein involved in type VI secretion
MTKNLFGVRGLVFLLSSICIAWFVGSHLFADEKESLQKKANVFLYPKTLTKEDKLKGADSEIEIKSDTTFIWIDLAPDARFGHPTEFIFISAEGTKVVKGSSWPVLNGKDLFRDGKDYQVAFPVKLSGEKKDPPSKTNIFVYPKTLTKEDKLEGANSGIEIKSETTFLWVDLMPDARFGHPTEFIFISSEGTKVIKGSKWPTLNGKDLFRDGKEYKVDLPIKMIQK